MTLPIDRTTKAALDANLVNGVTSDAPVLKANNDNLYNTNDELYNYVQGLIAAGTLQPYPHGLYRQTMVNAGLEVSQRYGPLGSLVLANGVSNYVVDRVKSVNLTSGVNANVSHVAVADLDGAGYGVQIVHAATPTNQGRLEQYYTLEAKDTYKLAGQKVVFALKVKAVGAMNRASVIARYKTSESSISSLDTLILSTGSIPISNLSWTVIPLVFTVPVRSTLTPTGVIGFEITGSKTTAESSGDGFIISELELIKADKDLGFQPRSYAEELALCQRYYEFLDTARIRVMDATSSFVFTRDFRPKRIAPTVTITTVAGTALTLDAARLNSVNLILTGAGVTDSTYNIKLDSEL